MSEENCEYVFIYALIDPRDNLIKYIGRCKNLKHRMMCHLTPTELNNGTKKSNWIKELLENDLKPIMIEIDHVPKKEQKNKETEWIKFYDKKNLTNLSDGPGTLGCIVSEESKRKNSEWHKGRPAWNKGIPFSEETRKNMSDAHKGKPGTMTGKHLTEEQRQKISKVQFGKQRQNNKSNCSSKYKGVSFSKNKKKYKAYIVVNGKQIHLGYFDNETDAAKKYNEAAIMYYGEKAILNIIEVNNEKTI
jgi:group I intron endonuclease